MFMLINVTFGSMNRKLRTWSEMIVTITIKKSLLCGIFPELYVIYVSFSFLFCCFVVGFIVLFLDRTYTDLFLFSLLPITPANHTSFSLSIQVDEHITFIWVQVYCLEWNTKGALFDFNAVVHKTPTVEHKNYFTLLGRKMETGVQYWKQDVWKWKQEGIEIWPLVRK